MHEEPECPLPDIGHLVVAYPSQFARAVQAGLSVDGMATGTPE